MPSWPSDPHRFEFRQNWDGDLVLFLNGILARPGDQFGWTDRAERWTKDYTSHHCDALEYFHTPILGPILNTARVYRDTLALLAGYVAAARVAGRSIRLHLVCHSYGCEIARKLILNSGMQFRTVHMFGAAISSNMERNGLNLALAAGHVGELCVYTSRRDLILKYLPPLSFGLYGRMGYEGPQHVAPLVQERVFTRERPTFGHSDWFAPENFRWAMTEVDFRIDDLPF